jgi:NitT/TauT family transport system substrate-binding protein
MKVIKVACLALCLALFAIGEAAAQDTKPQPNKTFTITINSWVGYGPLFIAKEKKFFGDVALDIKFIEDAGARRLAMISGSVDGYGSTVDNLAIDATFGVKGKTVLAFDESAGADGIVAKSSITWANIKKRTVAVQLGLPGHFLLLATLKQHGLRPGDVKILDLDADKAGSAFVAGSVDVAVTWEPWLSKASSMSGGKKLVTTEALPGLIVDTLVVRDPVLASKQAEIKAITAGWYQALEWYAANEKEGDAIIASAYNLKSDEVRETMTGIHLFDRKRNVDYFGTVNKPGQLYEVFRNASQLWKDAGTTKITVDAKPYIDSRFVE